jgi:RHS repeat-associated protein
MNALNEVEPLAEENIGPVAKLYHKRCNYLKFGSVRGISEYLKRHIESRNHLHGYVIKKDGKVVGASYMVKAGANEGILLFTVTDEDFTGPERMIAFENMTLMTDGRNNRTQFECSFGGGCGCGGTGSLVTRITYDGGEFETFKYDANGSLTLKTDCNNTSLPPEDQKYITYAYDALNRMTQKTYDASTVTFAYDKVSSMLSAEDSDSSMTFEYDNLYRMTSTTQQIDSNPSKTVEYAYGPVGNRTSMTGPDGIANSYTYTLVNQIASITDVYNYATNYYYDDGGRLTLRTYGNGTKAEYSYDDANRLTLLANKKSDDTVLSSFTYEHDKTGNRTKRTTQDATLQYTYDNIYEVTEVYRLSPDPSTLEIFSYDSVGNRTSDSDYSNYSYNSNNQLTSYDSVTFDYDKNGNLTKKTQNESDITTYTFDYENRLTRIDYPDETYSGYKYDVLGRRIEKRDRTSSISRYLYDGQNFIMEYDGNNDLVASYVQGLGIDEPIGVYRAGEGYWYHSDALGSTYQITDASQAVARHYDYSVFGRIVSESGTLANPLTYTARELDSESDLYYYRARYMIPTLGRFVSADPVGMPNGTNRYFYAMNSPTNWDDPSGKIVVVCSLYWYTPYCPLLGHSIICVGTPPGSMQCFGFGTKTGNVFGGEGEIFQEGTPHTPECKCDPVTRKCECEKIQNVVCSLLCGVNEGCVTREIERQRREDDIPHYVLPLYTCHSWVNELTNGCSRQSD